MNFVFITIKLIYHYQFTFFLLGRCGTISRFPTEHSSRIFSDNYCICLAEIQTIWMKRARCLLLVHQLLQCVITGIFIWTWKIEQYESWSMLDGQVTCPLSLMWRHLYTALNFHFHFKTQEPLPFFSNTTSALNMSTQYQYLLYILPCLIWLQLDIPKLMLGFFRQWRFVDVMRWPITSLPTQLSCAKPHS